MGGANPEFRASASVMPADMRREDGSIKGSGFLGNYANRGSKQDYGKQSSEISVGVEPERLGKNAPKPLPEGYIDVPTMVPTLNRNERDYLLDTPIDSLSKNNPRLFGHIADKAADFAKQRFDQGKSQWAAPNESPIAPPRFMARPTLQQQGIALLPETNIPSVNDYFKQHPEVAGMVTGAGANGMPKDMPAGYQINPYNNDMKDPKNRQSVVANESIRHVMNQTGYTPKFELPKEQIDWSKTLGAYATNMPALRQTIIARLASGDNVPNATPEEIAEAKKFIIQK
jgi:hypothetical protein